MADEILMPDLTDDLGRVRISEGTKKQIANTFAAIQPGKRGAFLVMADEQGNARAALAAKFGNNWKVAGGLSINLGEKRPRGYVGVEGSW